MLPFRALIALSASELLGISTKPYPLERPLNLFFMILSTSEVNQLGHGVCRDLAHLGIACCRALSIPARMVVGYLESLDPMDLHAWFEAYVGNRWYTFDPTRPDLKGGRIAIAFGRDAADVAIYTQFGNPVELLNLKVQVQRIPGPTDQRKNI